MITETPAPTAGRSYSRSKELYEAGRQFTTEGVQHSGRFQLPHPIYMARGEGGVIYDVDGNPYIDFTLGSGPLILGHAHPRVVKAVERQIEATQLYGAANEAELELARRIHERVPSAEMVRFLGSGTEATTTAIRLARAFTKRDLIVKNVGAFHGAMDYFLTGLPAAGGVDGNYPGVDRVISDKTLSVPFNDVEGLDKLLVEQGSRIAAVIVEPALRGVLAPQPGYLKALRERCDSLGILLVYDEVVTGFRLGPAGAEGYFGVKPDLSAFGKIIGGGFPIGAVAGREDVMYLLSPKCPAAEKVFSTGTWYGYPTAMVAGCATLDVLSEEGGYERLFQLGEHFRMRFGAIFERVGLPGQVLGVGPVNKVMMTDAVIHDHASAQPKYQREGLLKFKRRLFEHGLFMLGPAYLPGFGKYLSTAHTFEQIDQAAEIFEQSLSEADLGSYLSS